MIIQDSKADSIQKTYFHTIQLSKANQEIAERYLDMDQPEDPALLEQVKYQDLSSTVHWIDAKSDYLKWLLKKKKTEELGRLVRLLTEVGGASAWRVLVSFEFTAGPEDLEKTLCYLQGPHAEAQRMALRAGICALYVLRGNAEKARELCQLGKEDPEVFLEALDYCHAGNRVPVAGQNQSVRTVPEPMPRHDMGSAAEQNQDTRLRLQSLHQYDMGAGTEQDRNTRMLLLSMYLHHTEPGSAPEAVQALEEGLLRMLEDLMPLEKRELACIRDFARTAEWDTPFPNRILSIYSHRKSGINPSLAAVCAFLALRHSVRFEILFRLMAATDYRYQGRNLALQACMGAAEETYFDACMAEVEDMLPIPDENYVIWCLEYGYTQAVVRLADKCPEGIRRAAEVAVFRLYRELMEIIRHTDLCRELSGDHQRKYREKAASELVARVWPGKADAREYLLGNCPVDALEPHLKEWGNDLYEDKENHEILKVLKRMDPPMYRRGIVLEALQKMTGYFAYYPVFDQEPGVQDIYELLMDERQIGGLLQIFEEEGIPARYQTEALSGIGSGLDKKKRAPYLERCVEILIRRAEGQDGKAWEESMAETVREGSVSACCLCLQVLHRSGGGRYREIFLSCASNGTKQVRTLLLDICREYREWRPDILAFLESKKAKEREFAVSLLEEWGDPSCLEAVRAALEREKNKKLAASLQVLAEELEKEANGADAAQSGRAKRTEENLAAEIYKGSKRKKVEWVLSLSLPEVHRRNGETAPPEYLLAILTAYADMESPGRNPNADRLAESLDPEELSAYMMAFYEGWMSAGAEAKKRWALYVVSIHGGKAVVPVLHSQIKDWAEHSRGAMAAETVHALALSGSPEALRLVDQMSRNYKFRQVKNAAAEALKNAAAVLGISREELEDRLVPELGLDRKAERIFDYGPRSFTVRLSPSLEAEIFDGKGKRLKNLPAPNKQDDPEKAAAAGSAFKQMKKWLKETVSSQKLRLEQALSTARFWEPQKWQELFVANPVMHPFAIGLIWGVYERQELKGTFRYMEDGTFNTAAEEAYPFPKTGKIGLVHPLELSEEELAAWKEQLSDYEIVQPLEQLYRPVFRLKEEEKDEPAFTGFADRTLNGLSLSGRLLRMGWSRGEILDGGFYEAYHRRDGEIGAELTFSGCSVGCENEEVTTGALYFYRLLPAESGSRTQHAFRKENRLLPGEVNPRYFSEVALQVSDSLHSGQ